MKTVAATLSALLLVSAGVLARPQAPRPPSADSLRAVVKTYLEIQALLAQDKFEGLQGAAGTLTAQTAALGKDGAGLAKAASAFAAAKDIRLARDAFGPLSDALIARVKADGSPTSRRTSGWASARCAQVVIQRDEPVRNPYYGATMLPAARLQPISPPGK